MNALAWFACGFAAGILMFLSASVFAIHRLGSGDPELLYESTGYLQ